MMMESKGDGSERHSEELVVRAEQDMEFALRLLEPGKVEEDAINEGRTSFTEDELDQPPCGT